MGSKIAILQEYLASGGARAVAQRRCPEGPEIDPGLHLYGYEFFPLFLGGPVGTRLVPYYGTGLGTIPEAGYLSLIHI